MITFRTVSSLAKPFLDTLPEDYPELKGLSAFRGERVSWQILYRAERGKRLPVNYIVETSPSVRVTVRTLESVPCAMTTFFGQEDDAYLRTAPGLFPDVLRPEETGFFEAPAEMLHSLFVTCFVNEDAPAGVCSVIFRMNVDGEDIAVPFKVDVLPFALPKDRFEYTTICNPDCIANIHKVEIGSAAHWELMEKYIRMAAYTGITGLMMPAFTFPLDTDIGKYRVPFQFVKITRKGEKYSFDFTLLRRWIRICKDTGMTRFTMMPLFSQWGSGFAPQVWAETENGNERIFGWEDRAVDAPYRTFLKAFLPELCECFKQEGIWDRILVSISDEPSNEKDFEIYKQEWEMVTEFIPASRVIEGLSDIEFVQKGIVHYPLAIVSQLDKFAAMAPERLWMYYCCVPTGGHFANRLIAMPSSRCRVIGFIMYLYNLEGFSHWGYNFYYSQLAKKQLNPFMSTDADEGFPAGDPFMVYPTDDGPIEAIRSVVFYEGIQDYKACLLLEKKLGRDAVIEFLRENGILSANNFPLSDEVMVEIRQKLNAHIAE